MFGIYFGVWNSYATKYPGRKLRLWAGLTESEQWTVTVQTKEIKSLETRIKSAYRKLLTKEMNYTSL